MITIDRDTFRAFCHGFPVGMEARKLCNEADAALERGETIALKIRGTVVSVMRWNRSAGAVVETAVDPLEWIARFN